MAQPAIVPTLQLPPVRYHLASAAVVWPKKSNLVEEQESKTAAEYMNRERAKVVENKAVVR